MGWLKRGYHLLGKLWNVTKMERKEGAKTIETTWELKIASFLQAKVSTAKTSLSLALICQY